ncbi:hypothetical protein V6N11_016779 [Hibiscus sabdariffa]|uniref:(+)-delta-cadinene synthase n=1 Tax=Hibiscus sabdariffa TaxID=183260 RepID=A0ABR2TWQ2_9ROSI
MKRVSQVYYVEAKWLHENYIPTMKEYMLIALISCGYPNLTIASFVGMEETITTETFIWALNDPKILRASKYKELKEQARRMLMTDMDNPSQKLDLIDAVQRLGVAYHFQKEIQDALQIIYHHHCNHTQIDDLYTTPVRFHLLREHGFHVDSETFNKFKDEEGDFKESLISDVKGMLQLYEAAHFQLHGEIILEEALSFTNFHLKLAETKVDYPLSSQVADALNRPLRKSLPRLVARSYISIYQGYGTHDPNLLKFAKLDFKIVQHLHKKELYELNRWWRGLDVPINFPFTRDRFVECYFWILGVYFEPHYIVARNFTTKVIALISILDDIYDAYGTYEELEIFTKAIQRWDINCIDQLPNYMKVWYREVLNVYKVMGDLMSKERKTYRVQFVIDAMKRQSQVYYVEAKWFHENYIPTMEEYMSIALMSCAYPNLTIASLVGMEDNITKETFVWAFNVPKILKASSTICRLMDDVVSHEFEHERGHVSSAVECYMKQYGTSMQATYDELFKQIKDAWKDINEGFLKPMAASTSVLHRILNLAKVIDLYYKGEDAYTLAGFRDDTNDPSIPKNGLHRQNNEEKLRAESRSESSSIKESSSVKNSGLSPGARCNLESNPEEGNGIDVRGTCISKEKVEDEKRWEEFNVTRFGPEQNDVPFAPIKEMEQVTARAVDDMSCVVGLVGLIEVSAEVGLKGCVSVKARWLYNENGPVQFQLCFKRLLRRHMYLDWWDRVAVLCGLQINPSVWVFSIWRC